MTISKVTIGLDVGDRCSQVFGVDDEREVIEEGRSSRLAQARPRSLSLMPVALLLLLVAGCSGKSEPELEEWTDGAYRPREVSAYEVDGKRDGATTRAVATFTLESGRRLQLELEVSYDPAPVLRTGHWRIDGAHPDSGTVHAESMKFLGGQNEGPSLGGRFRLDRDDRPRFRVVLPLRPLSQPKWQLE